MSHPDAAPVPPNQARLLRDLTGIGFVQAREALRLAGGPDFGGDVVLAVAYLEARKLAIHVKGDRHAWNLAKAHGAAADLRERAPALPAAFPAPAGSPRP